MKLALPLLLGLLALCVEMFLREAFALDAWSPDFLAVLLLWLGTTRQWTEGAVVAATLGVLADGFAGSPLGLHLLHALFLFHAAALLGGQVRFHGLVGRCLLGVAGGVVSLFLLVALSRIFLGDTRLAARIGALLVPRVAVVAAATPLLFPLLDRLDLLLVRRPDTDVL